MVSSGRLQQNFEPKLLKVKKILIRLVKTVLGRFELDIVRVKKNTVAFNTEYLSKLGNPEIIKDEGYRNTLIAKGKENAVRFSAETISRQYARLYEEVHSNYLQDF